MQPGFTNLSIQPGLLYGSPVWYPCTQQSIIYLKSPQYKFIRYLLYRTGAPMSRLDHDLSHALRNHRLPTVKSLHDYHYCLMVFKIVNVYVNSAQLFDLFRVRAASYRNRNPPAVSEQLSRSSLHFYSAIPRLRRGWNRLSHVVRSIITIGRFKTSLRNQLYKYS